MRRNIVSVFLALVLVLMMGTAVAEESVATPSIFVGNLTSVEGVEYPANFNVYATIVYSDTIEEKVFNEMKIGSVASQLGDEAMAKAAAYLPAGLDLSTLVLDWVDAIEVEGYQAEYGDVKTLFDFPAEYQNGDILLAVVGIIPDNYGVTDEQISWFPMMTEIVEGKVMITLTQEVLEMMTEQEAVLAMLCVR